MKRELDPLGRFVIPKHLRQELEMHPGDKVDIVRKNNTLVLKKADVPCCLLCRSEEKLLYYNKNFLCRECWSGFSQALYS